MTRDDLKGLVELQQLILTKIIPRTGSGRELFIYSRGCDIISNLAKLDLKSMLDLESRLSLIDHIEIILRSQPRPIGFNSLLGLLDKRWPKYRREVNLKIRLKKTLERTRNKNLDWFGFAKTPFGWEYWYIGEQGTLFDLEVEVNETHKKNVLALIDQIALDLSEYKTTKRKSVYTEGRLVLISWYENYGLEHRHLVKKASDSEIKSVKKLKDMIRRDLSSINSYTKRKLYQRGRDSIMALVRF
jgi:hypothetical protein